LKSTKTLKKEQIFALVAIGLLAIVVSISTASAASQVYVNTTGSDTDGDGSANLPYLTIGYGVQQVDNGGTVFIASGTYTGDGNKNIVIEKNIDMRGAGQEDTIIDAEGSSRVFTVKEGYLLDIKDLTIKNGNAVGVAPVEESGGAIQNEGLLIVENVKFTGNQADSGGAISNGGTTTVKSSTFTSNTASYWGGAITNSGILTVTGSIFTTNSASEGGAIFNLVNATITGNTFEGNTVTSRGAAIFTWDLFANDTLIANNNRFIGNSPDDLVSEDVSTTYSSTIDLKNNWWGSATGPAAGQVVGTTNYTPWLTSDPNGTTPPADTTAPKVTATPAGGSYYSPQNIALAADEIATIYYTIDGSDPTKSSTLYSGPIGISTSKTLKFTAWDSAGNQALISTLKYNIYKKVSYSYIVKVPYKKFWYKSWYKLKYKKWYKKYGKWRYKWRYKWKKGWKYKWLYTNQVRWGTKNVLT